MMGKKIWMKRWMVPLLLAAISVAGLTSAKDKPVKVFVIAGDENCLAQAPISGRADVNGVQFYPGVATTNGEPVKRVTCAVYPGAYAAGTDYDKRTPEVTSMVEIGEPRTKPRPDKQKGRLPVTMTPFPALALEEGHTTVLRGALVVPVAGRHEIAPGGCNVTLVDGKEVYRREAGQTKAVITPIQLEAKKRYAFTTVFFQKPAHDFRVSLLGRANALETVLAQTNRYAFLRDAAGQWVTRSDVELYDAHPIYNETLAPGHLLGVMADAKNPQYGMGPEVMLGHVLGEHFDEPVMLLRFATRHYIGFMRGSRSLGHDYLPPSSGGDVNAQGRWDVIHFNFGVHDSAHRNPEHYTDRDKNKWPITVSVAQYEDNLRKIVAKLKATGATLIWARTTPIADGTDGWFKNAEAPYNEVADRIMAENGVIIDDLHAESVRQGFPNAPNVHSVGHLAPKVTQSILAALASRKESTKPWPQVLLIGDSITGTYLEEVTKNLDGKAVVFKNPANAGHTGNGLANMDAWLDLKHYLQGGQEYLELVNGIKNGMAQFGRFCPDFPNQGAELAGLVWLQGIADCQSPAQAAGYEKNLASLIRDLRKDLQAPKLPVVVAAVGYGDGKVHDAQMAVGDPAQYPEFAGNVKSVDTRVLAHAYLPGSISFCYNENAGTFLAMGEALGHAMLELMPAATTK